MVLKAEITVLHVDDEPDLAELAAEFLERENDRITVETATNVSEALDSLVRHDVDCIVSDYDMPGQDGIELLDTVREEYPDRPFILYTGKGSEEIASRAIRAGVTDYLQKEAGTDDYTILANRIVNAVEHYRANSEIERQRDLFAKTQKIANVGAWEYDIETDTFYNTDEVLRIHGLSTDASFDAERSVAHYHPDDRPTIREAFQQVVDTGEPYDLELRLIDDNGDQRWVQTRAESQTEDGEIVRVRGTIQDITDRKRREQELETVFQRMDDAVFVHTEDGSFIFINQTAIARYGYPESELRELTPWDLDASSQTKDVSGRIDRIMRDGQVVFETEHRTAAGEVIPVEINATRISFRGTPAILAIARDISERRERQCELEQIETLFENAQDGLFLINVDEEFTVERVNPAYEDASGLSEAQIRGQTPKEVLGDQQGATVEAKYRTCVERQEPLQYHERVQLGGQVRDWNTRIAPVVIDGTVAYLVGSTRDITDQKARERELQKYETIIEALTDAVYVLDEEGRFIYVSDEFVDLVGYDRKTILGNTPSLIKDETAIERAEQELGRLLSSDGPDTVRFEVTIRPKDDDSLICQDHMGVLPYDGDRFDGSVGILRDITERKERERQLERERERYNTLFETLPNPVLYSRTEDGEPVVQTVNQAFVDTFGYDAEEIAGEPVQDYILPEGQADAAERHNQRVLSEGDVRTEVQRKTTDGIRTFRLNVSTRHTENGHHERYAVYTDITERTEYEQELETKNQRLDEFTSVVSHDLRNPLTVAEGHLELAQEHCENDHLAQAADAIERSQALIDDLLTLAREGDSVNDVELVSLAEVAEHSWQTVETCQATLDAEIPRVIEADQNRLQQLFENLYANAIKHGGQDVTVSVGAIDEGFYVADTGSGIPDGERDAIFEIGYSTDDDGTGVGLRIVERIAEAHGWDITVADSEHGGARFEITGVEFGE